MWLYRSVHLFGVNRELTETLLIGTRSLLKQLRLLPVVLMFVEKNYSLEPSNVFHAVQTLFSFPFGSLHSHMTSKMRLAELDMQLVEICL